jgi:Ni2+-binding GTPase involved in maturation of urease and hydrogenase
MNLAAIEDMNQKFPHAEVWFIESGAIILRQPSAPSWRT